MSAPDLELLPLSEEELNPHVLVVTGDRARFEPYKEHIESCGFPCEVYSEIQDVFTYVHSRGGVVVFFSWDLPDTNVKAMVSILSANLGVDCIVFSESDDVQSRAMMASCGFKQTIQPPYNEKNFAMAVKKIASDRYIENEKRLRKMRHHERFFKAKSKHESADPAEDLLMQQEATEHESSPALHFSSENPESGGLAHFHGEEVAGGSEIVHSENDAVKASIHKGESRPGKLHMIDGDRNDGGMKMFKGQEEKRRRGGRAPAGLSNAAKDRDQGGMTEDAENVRELVYSRPDAVPEGGSSGSWKEVHLPSLPATAEAPGYLGKKNKRRLKEKSSLSGFDWLLLILGSAIGLGLCAYILAQVFILPYIN